MKIRVLQSSSRTPRNGRNTAYLHVDNWNDFSFVTMFSLSLHDDEGIFHEIGTIKIGFKGQDESVSTFTEIDGDFEFLQEGFFSLGMDVEYYRKMSSLPVATKEYLLVSLRDMAFDNSHVEIARDERVFRTSILRDVSISVIKGQYRRVLDGYPPLTDFEFTYIREPEERMGGVKLKFDVKEGSTPSTNIHAIIGRNGVGKTTLLNGMITAIMDTERSSGKFFDSGLWNQSPIAEDYFSSLVSVSFSAFDPFIPPEEQSDPSKGTCYFYIGLKNKDDVERLYSSSELNLQCVDALLSCFSMQGKTRRWLKAIKSLGSDNNFSEMNLLSLETDYRVLRETYADADTKIDYKKFKDEYGSKIELKLSRMSSGHAVVLLTMSRLVATVEEKTLLLIDEPESHLHPPLLSAFIRSLSELLHDRNGVAIIATHSPVVLQEIPKSCAWKISRTGMRMEKKRLQCETFGENVGVLTREVFGLEVVRSGFHQLLVDSVDRGNSFEEILEEYSHQLGFEARAILKSLVLDRDRGVKE